MDDYNKRLQDIIKDEIKNYSIEKLKSKRSEDPNKKRTKSDYEKIKEEEDIDNTVFFGGSDPKSIRGSRQSYIKEGEEPEGQGNQSDDPRITQTEIDEFEQEFREKVSPLVSFKKNASGTIDFVLYKGDSGIDAKVSGVIPAGAENRIDWSYSLQDGAYVKMSSELTPEVSDIIHKLTFFYEEWRRDWTEKLTETPG